MGSGLMSPSHIALVLLVALLVLGPKRLPEVGRSLGNGLRGFRDAIGGGDDHEGFGGSLRDAFSEGSHAPEHETAAPSPAAPVQPSSSSPSADRYPLVGQDPHIAAAAGSPRASASPSDGVTASSASPESASPSAGPGVTTEAAAMHPPVGAPPQPVAPDASAGSSQTS